MTAGWGPAGAGPPEAPRHGTCTRGRQGSSHRIWATGCGSVSAWEWRATAGRQNATPHRRMQHPLVQVDDVVVLIPSRLHHDLLKLVPPVQLSGQVGAARHEGVAKLREERRGSRQRGGRSGAVPGWQMGAEWGNQHEGTCLQVQRPWWVGHWQRLTITKRRQWQEQDPPTHPPRWCPRM